MKKLSPILGIALVLAVLAALPWLAWAADDQARDAAPEACGTVTLDSIFFADSPLLVEDAVQPMSFCPTAFCLDTADCRQACPSAPNPVCLSNRTCDYGFGGGGGGGGGGSCPCPTAFCIDVFDCLSACPQANNAQCNGNVCSYQC